MRDKIVLEPLQKSLFDIDAWWTQLDALGAASFLLEGPAAAAPGEADETIDLE